MWRSICNVGVELLYSKIKVCFRTIEHFCARCATDGGEHSASWEDDMTPRVHTCVCGTVLCAIRDGAYFASHTLHFHLETLRLYTVSDTQGKRHAYNCTNTLRDTPNRLSIYRPHDRARRRNGGTRPLVRLVYYGGSLSAEAPHPYAFLAAQAAWATASASADACACASSTRL